MASKINFASPISTHMGYAEMGRLIWPALRRVGNVGCMDIRLQSNDADMGHVAKEMLAAKPFDEPDITVINMVPVLWDGIRGNTKNVGYTTFEADRLPDGWAKKINEYDACWTTSHWNKEVMVSSGVTVPVHAVMPIAISAGQIRQSPKSGKFRFLSSFQWSERKNPSALIRAFCAAFNGNPDVQLVLKSHVNANSHESAAIISKEIASIVGGMKLRKAPDIQLVTKIHSYSDVHKLNDSSHAHISLTHGEGWGLPPWEAALAGKPVITTGWSAPAEWLGSSYPFLVKYNMTPVAGVNPKISPFFNATMNWAEPHLDDAIDKLRYVFNNYSDACRVAGNRRTEMLETFTEESTFAAIKSSLHGE